MLRSSLIVAGAAILCSAATAQSQIEPSRVYPVTAPIKHAGTVDVATGQWTRGTAQNAGNTIIFNNTCTWTGGAFYAGLESCEDNYDEGRLPSPGDPNAPANAQTSYNIACFQVAYCTFNANNFPLKVGFWNNLNGACVGGIPPTPPPASTTATAYFDLTPLGLPGSTATGFQACWIVTLTTTNFTMLADGDGVFDNNPALDLFTWSWSHENPTQPVGPDGILINGDPNLAPPGSCSFAQPCANDPFSGTPCGTGLGATDNNWINVDGVAVGDTLSGNCPNGVAPFGGTNCYFFGGYPTNPFASYWLEMEADIGPACAPATTYCTPKTSSNNCTPTIGSQNLPSISAGNFTVTGTQIEGVEPTILIYSVTGPNSQPFQGGFLCVQPQIFRLPLQNSGGTPDTCTGNPTRNVTTTLASVGAGNPIWFQWWFRDSGAVSGSGLSNGLQILSICP